MLNIKYIRYIYITITRVINLIKTIILNIEKY